jgi:glycosyltransferase involved in cell wall biosynthesis
MSHLLKNIDRSRFLPALVVMEKTGPYFSQLPDDIQIYDLDVVEENPLHFPRIVSRLRKILKQFCPDILCSMLWYANLAAVLAAQGIPGVKTVISERISTSYEIENETVIRPLQYIKRLLIRSMYPCAAHIVTVSEGIAAELVERFGVRYDQVSYIHNPVDSEYIRQQCNSSSDPWPDSGIRLLAIGRLSHQKGFDLLIRAVARLSFRMNLHLVILGEGSERANLEKLVEDERVSGRVILPGFADNPYRWMKYADMFILSSRAEGFPNVLLEAMACGLPVIATDCRTGPRELLIDGEVCPLIAINDLDGLAIAIEEIASNRQYALELRDKVVLRARDFTIRSQIGQYESLFAKLAAKDPV